MRIPTWLRSPWGEGSVRLPDAGEEPAPSGPSVLVWLLPLLGIVALELLAGPEIRFTILYALPIALATRYGGRSWGLALAVLVPLTRLSHYLHLWTERTGLVVPAINASLRVAGFVGLVLLVDRLTWQARRIRTLEEFIRICMFCKRIRDDDREWHELEHYISARTQSQFSHFICPACAKERYGYEE